MRLEDVEGAPEGPERDAVLARFAMQALLHDWMWEPAIAREALRVIATPEAREILEGKGFMARGLPDRLPDESPVARKRAAARLRLLGYRDDAPALALDVRKADRTQVLAAIEVLEGAGRRRDAPLIVPLLDYYYPGERILAARAILVLLARGD